MSSDDPKKSRRKQKSDLRAEVSGDHGVGASGDVKDSVVIAGNVGGGVTIVKETLAAASPPPRQLPSDLADFKGRDHEVNELMRALAQDEGRVAISAIGGLGGIGKSALAVRVAHKLVDRYPDGQIVVDMQGTSERPVTAIEAMARVIQAYRPESRLADDLEQVAQDYHNVLAGKHALILLDNAINAAQVRPLMPSPPCALIITSRRSIVLPGLRPINLDALSEKNASDLLSSITGEGRATEEQLDSIAELCGHLPLALRVAGTFLAVHRDWTVAEYIETLTDERIRLAHLKQDDLDVEATLALSARQLESERPDLAAHWKTLAVFPADFDREAAGAVWGVTIEEARDNLSALLERSLILFDDEISRYRLHDLVRLFTNAQLSEAERAASQWRHASHYKTVLGKTNALYLQGGEAIKQGLAMFDLEWRNIQAAQAWAASCAEKDDAAAELCSDYSHVGVYTLYLRQHPRDRIRWLKAALSAARHLKQRLSESNALGNLGVAYADLGETRRAIEYYEQQLVIVREIGDRRGEGIALGNLGVAYKNLGETRRAIEYYEQYLAIAREIGYRRGEGDALFNMSLVLDQLDDRAQAILNAEAALKIYEQIESPSADRARNLLAKWCEQK